MYLQLQHKEKMLKWRREGKRGVKDFVPTTGINIRYIVPHVILSGKHYPSKV